MLYIGLLALCLLTLARPGSTQDADSLQFYETVLRLSEKVERNPQLRALWDEQVQRLDDLEMPIPEFKCDVSLRSAKRPTNVHEVRPGDIDVIAAFGDSITAGNGLGARNPVEVAVENRGESWTIGGDRRLEEGVITLPNIIKKFNPMLKGYSTCVSPEFLTIEFREWFNVARPGGRADHNLAEAQKLVERMKRDERVDFENDWKLLSFFVGGNDFCSACRANRTAEYWYATHERALVYLKENMPRTIVNLVSMFDVTPLQNMSRNILCDLLQWGFCDCARNWTTLPMLRPLQLQYTEVFNQLASEERFHSDDFTVVVQPHLRDMLPPIDPDTGDYIKDILSPDCFHPSRLMHQQLAIWLWNIMLVPVGHKPFEMDSSDFDPEIACPTLQHPYIFTNQNSIGVEWPPAMTGCGNVLTELTDDVNMPIGWDSMCHILSNHSQASTSCRNLLVGLPRFGNADNLLAAGGNFGCYISLSTDSGMSPNACYDNYQHDTVLTNCLACQVMYVCVRFPELPEITKP